ncbi:hypothetical protein Psal006b_03292 (plasmid) [Piscirickettsia salmonis]|uniref:Uncharacterized protein n=4 Tax=Piscirickettsia salmonis TaxID=1238 RepID=A0AAC8VLL1_PISSA|nr:hypothetical protein [Piscirickettsia salmonis]ALB24670.1 hypothetical protein KU39_3p208 [Piscirickettsia salmonis]ALT18841.1 hypothetical protein PSLF89_08335 [Piscirickettsia salmonis LF-89 = ATCC VR-1361]ALY04536.1 hypothetical protein AWE47_16650 [Piscirickettsia salmonis]AMA43903.1 hypothetical protein AWJ11_16060 [Piscirickettsia salmonis]AOS37121.1 hypothetical protein AVM72_17390 [Piscirickettsia salmonis]
MLPDKKMDIAKILSELKTASPDEQISTIRDLRERANPGQLKKIDGFINSEYSLWLKNALSNILGQGEEVVTSSLVTIQDAEEVLDIDAIRSEAISDSIGQILHELEPIIGSINLAAQNETSNRKRRYLGRYFAHPMMQNRRAKRDDYKPSAVRVTQRCMP